MTSLANVIYAGDTLEFTTSAPDYPASAGWTLKHRLAPRVAGAEIDIVAAASGDDHLTSASAATTAGWATGWYTYTTFVEKGAERYTLERGQLQVLSASTNLADGTDGRSHARKVLDAIEAVIEGRASLDQQEYAINGRSLKRMPIADLLKLRQLYRAEVAGEEVASRLAAGLGGGRKVQVRL